MSARQRARLLPVAILGAVLAAALVLFVVPDSSGARGALTPRRRAVKLASAEATVLADRPGVNIPGSFLGLSTEYWDLPTFERHLVLFERTIDLIHAPGQGPLVLRIGGDSSDQTFWKPRARNEPRWVFRLTPGWLRRTSILVRRDDVKLILDLNLVTGTPERAAQWASAAERGLPHGSIIGFEIGNEPDLYSRSVWLSKLGDARTAAALLPRSITAAGYEHDFGTYERALAAVAPQVPLLGPAIAHPRRDIGWISGLLSHPDPGLGTITAHRYPYSACARRTSGSYPTIARILSGAATAGLARSVKAAVLLAHRAGLPFRLTELNSVTCGGLVGVSNTFATALWAPDALFELLRTGVDGVNIHVRADAVNAAFALTRHGLDARPLLYGMIMFARALGPRSRLVPVHQQAGDRTHLKIWAVTVGSRALHVLVINKSSRGVDVRLRLPATSPATIQRLLARSAASTGGITLDGRWLAPNVSWQGKPRQETVNPGAHGYTLVLPKTSAALVEVRLQLRAAGRSERTRSVKRAHETWRSTARPPS